MTGEEYCNYCNLYNEKPVIDQKAPQLPNIKLYSSYMSRAKETARLATGRHPEVLDNVYELTFNSYKDHTKPKNFYFLEFMARMQWLLNNRRQKEVREDTVKRINKAIDELEQKNEDAIIVMHSFVMKVMSRLLKKRGYHGKRLYVIKNGEAFTYSKEKM